MHFIGNFIITDIKNLFYEQIFKDISTSYLICVNDNYWTQVTDLLVQGATTHTILNIKFTTVSQPQYEELCKKIEGYQCIQHELV